MRFSEDEYTPIEAERKDRIMNFSLASLRLAAGNLWRSDASLRAALGNNMNVWLLKVSRLAHSPKMDDTEDSVVKGMRDNLVDGVQESIGQPSASVALAALGAAAYDEKQRAIAATATGADQHAIQPVEQRAKVAWDKDAKMRAEFGDNFATYLAFCRADDAGQVRISRPARGLSRHTRASYLSGS